MDIFLSAIGLIGGLLVLSAYIPQIAKLVRVRSSKGISVTSWVIWLFGSILFLIYTIYTEDPVFIIIEFLDFSFIAVVLTLAWYYRKPASRRRAQRKSRKVQPAWTRAQ